MTTTDSATSIWDWDVFLSFRGRDTRYKFTDHLYNNLIRRKGIDVFRDEERLKTGHKLTPSLVKAIEGSRISVVVFSKNYSSSDACLDELETIVRCKEDKQQIVVPIFYEVEPSELRHQGFDAHERKYGKKSDKVLNWKHAVEEASKLKGELYTGGYEYDFIDKIVKKISGMLGPPRLYVAANPVGLKSRISVVILHMGSFCSDEQDVHMLGIYGISGIGKTTLAKAFYNSVAAQFESACFVDEVRVKSSAIDGLVRIQETILGTILGDTDIKLDNIHVGMVELQQRLLNKKILLILDDVDELQQLEVLAGGCNWFGRGSRVVITTRHRDLLRQHGIGNARTYELKQLQHHEALELFCWHAFKKSTPEPEFVDISNHLTEYAQGIPLALKIIGADLYGKERDEWKSTLARHKKIMTNDIFTRLEVCYDKLNHYEKQMLLDIACYFNGEPCDYLEKVFQGCKFEPKSGWRTPEEKCFIRRQDGKVWMHELVQNMAMEIVRKESEDELGKRSRLWHHGDVLEVLTTKDSGTNAIQGLMLELPLDHREVEWDDNCFKQMKKLRIMIIRNARFSTPPKHLPNSLIVLNWEDYPFSSIPSDFEGNKLVDLRLGNAIHPIQLGVQFKNFEKLRYLRIARCDHVTKVPDLSCVVHLLELHLDFCRNLVEFDHSNGSILLPELEVFSAIDCRKLRECPAISSRVLKIVNLSGCCRIQYVPPMPSVALREVYLQGSGEFVAWSFCENEEKNCPMVFVPGYRIPRFFRCYSPGSSLSFQVRRRLPTICVAFALRKVHRGEEDAKLCYEISFSLGKKLMLFRKGDIPKSCGVFFCNISNALTEEEKILPDDWVDAQVKGIVTLCNTSERVGIRECGISTDSSELNFTKPWWVLFRDPSDEYNWYRNKGANIPENDVKIRFLKEKGGWSLLEFDYVGDDSDDHDSNYGDDDSDDHDGNYASSGFRFRAQEGLSQPRRAALSQVEDAGCPVELTKARARLHLPMMGWAKLTTVTTSRSFCSTREAEFEGVFVRDWTGRFLVSFPAIKRTMNFEFGTYTDIDEELRGIQKCLEWAVDKELGGIQKGLEWAVDNGGLNNIIIESYSEETIHRLEHGVARRDDPTFSLVQQCCELLKGAQQVRLVLSHSERLSEAFLSLSSLKSNLPPEGIDDMNHADRLTLKSRLRSLIVL